MTKNSTPAKTLLITALLPVFAANLCYVVSVASGHIPLCFTYLEGCTSISSTGRHGLGYVIFKLAMLPQALLLWIFWGREPLFAGLPGPDKVIRISGRLGAAFLVIYVVFLGAETPIYALMRRYGVFVYFIGTFVAMCRLSWQLWRTTQTNRRIRSLIILCALMLVLGLAEIPLGKFGLADKHAENFIEWNFALLMQLWFLAFWWHWRHRHRAT